MNGAAIHVEGIGKRYQLGLTHAGSVRELVNRTARRLVGRRNEHADGPASRKASAGQDTFWALRDISFSVQPGEVIGIIGKNGAGKSTLLKILSQITKPTTGWAQLRGRVASLLEVGTGFHPELTGRENIYMNGTILGMTRQEIDRRFDDIVEFAGVAKFIDTPVKRYSSGMTVRLGFAVAAHVDPQILIVDEVLAVGDAEFQRKCIGKMRSVADSGKTVLFVSHNLQSIRSLTTRSIVLQDGQMIFNGSTPDAIDRYLAMSFDRESDLPLAQKDRPFDDMTRALEFAELSLTVPEGHDASKSDALCLNVGIHAHTAVDDFTIGLTVFHETQVPVGSTFSAPLPSPPTGDRSRFEFVIESHNLAPGRYYCAISLASARTSGELHDSLAHVMPFEIPADPMSTRIWNSTWGMTRLPELQPVGAEHGIAPAPTN